MKISCDVARDLLPLYVEGLASQDSAGLLEEHLAECEGCRARKREMEQPEQLPAETDTGTFQKVKAKIKRKKRNAVLLSVFFSVIITGILLVFITSPQSMSYYEGIAQVETGPEGSLLLQLPEGAAGCQVSSYSTQEGLVLHVTFWNSLFSEYTGWPAGEETLLLNPSGEKAAAVYYASQDGSPDVLMYGEDQAPSGGMVSLPRLALGYYALLAGGAAAALWLISLAVRRKEKMAVLLRKTALFPLSYLLAHLCVKGFQTASYFVPRDLLAILLLTFPIFFLLAFLYGVWRKKRSAPFPQEK